MALPGYLKQFTRGLLPAGLVPHAMPGDGLTRMLQSFFRDSVRRLDGRDAPRWRPRRWSSGVAPPARSSGGNTCSSNDWGRIPEPAPRPGPYTGLEGVTMTKKTRYFLFGPVTVLLVGLCTGLVAYYIGLPWALQPRRPARRTPVRARRRHPGGLRDVRDVMTFRLPPAASRRDGAPRGTGSDSRQTTGINIEHDIDHVVAFHRRRPAAEHYSGHGARQRPLRRRQARGAGARARRPGRGLQGQAPPDSPAPTTMSEAHA